MLQCILVALFLSQKRQMCVNVGIYNKIHYAFKYIKL